MHFPDSENKPTEMPNLPREIIDDILYRLPAKTIGRFRCVSKAWLAFLTQPHFILTHLKLTRKNPTYSLLSRSGSGVLYSAPINNARHLFDEMSTRATQLTFPDHPDNREEIIASCDGLVLVLDYPSKLRIINPTTKAMRKVPRWPFSSGYIVFKDVYRLAYDEFDDDYKVIILSYCQAVKDGGGRYVGMLIGVFSLKSGVWTSLDISRNPYQVEPYPRGLVFVNGCMHYMATKISDNSYVIVAFSFRDEKFYEVPFTRALDRTENVVLCILGGCLCMVIYCFDLTVVWILKEYGVKESWIKLKIPAPGSEFCRPLCLLGEEHMVIERSNFQLAIYE